MSSHPGCPYPVGNHSLAGEFTGELTPALTIDQTLWQCFRYFANADQMNAAMHTAIVRYSPITFRVAEHLAPILGNGWLTADSEALLWEVLNHRGAYQEDPGRD